jgi:hypothetical protein
MNGRSQMQGGKNWILAKEINANRFFWDSRSWAENLEKPLTSLHGSNKGSVAMDSVGHRWRAKHRLLCFPIAKSTQELWVWLKWTLKFASKLKKERKKERIFIYLLHATIVYYRASSMALIFAHCVVYTLVRHAEAFDRYRRGQVT